MLTLEQIKAQLADARIAAVSAATGIHRNTLSAIRNGRNDNPKYSVIKALSEYFCHE